MSAPLMGAASATVLLGLSPWILPLIAIAAKLKEKPPHDAIGRCFLCAWLGRKSDAEREDRSPDQPITDARIKPKPGAM